MGEYIRSDLATIHPAELSEFLKSRGIICTTYLDTDGLHINTDIDATAALAAFVPTSTLNRDTLETNYIPSIPSGAAIATHLQHLKDYRANIRNNGPAPTAAQTSHVIADLIDALRFIDSRFDRDL